MSFLRDGCSVGDIEQVPSAKCHQVMIGDKRVALCVNVRVSLCVNSNVINWFHSNCNCFSNLLKDGVL